MQKLSAGKFHFFEPPFTSFDHLIGAQQYRSRHLETKGPRGLEINDEIELAWLLHRKIGRLLALENSACVSSDLVIRGRGVSSVAYQASNSHEIAISVDRRNLMAGRQRDKFIANDNKERIGAY